jgi:Na+-translocating ferredoxin:NAD+ oxidoreductase RnfG subunit
MTSPLRGWTMLSLAVVSVPAPAFAVQYVSAEEAMRSAFPGADAFEPVRPAVSADQWREIDRAAHAPVASREPRAWLARSGGRVIGRYYVDEVLGKQLYITYSVAVNDVGQVLRVDILEYRETHGYEVRNTRWLKQFVGATASSTLEPGIEVKNISGATLSCRHVTEGVHRLLLIDRATLGS